MARGTISNFHQHPGWGLSWEVTPYPTYIHVKLHCYPNTSGGYFGYLLKIGARVAENGSESWSRSITGRNSVDLECNLTRNTGGNSTIQFKLACTAPGCVVGGDHAGGAVRGSYKIGPSYTTPNIAIDSLNGVSIARGENNYSISVNANQVLDLGYSVWSGAIGSVDSCYFDAWVGQNSNGQGTYWGWIKVKDDGDGKPAGSVRYKSLLDIGLPFSYDGKYVWLYLSRVHKSSGVRAPYLVHTNIRLMKVLFTPIKSVTITKQPLVTYTQKSDIDISWKYPDSPSLINQYGIVSGYEIRLINKSTGEIIKTYDSNVNNYSIPSSDYNPLTKYYAQIIPYYLNGNSKSYGPSKNTDDFMLITKLDPPSISYPLTGDGCVWIGNRIYVLGQLPYDSDSEFIGDSYQYRDIEVVINDTVYKFSTDKNKFSLIHLTNNSKFVFVSDNNVKFNNIYNIKVRVQKNYSFDGTNYKWSDYTDVLKLNAVSVPNIPKYSGYVMHSHYNDIQNIVSKMRNCYIDHNTDSILSSIVDKGNYINRSDFQNVYNDLLGISQLIDQWGDYDNDTIKVKFMNNNKFDPKQEYITDVKNDTNPIGNNYFILSYEWIRYYG